jgi:O-antigen/teichoic acid export membrane protein
MSDNLKTIAQDGFVGGFYLFVGNILSTLIWGVGTIIIARVLGPEEYGLYSLALVVPSILAHLVDLGINRTLTRFSAKFRVEGKEEAVPSIIRSGIVFKSIISILVFILCFNLADVFAVHLLQRPELTAAIRIALLLVPARALLTATDSAFIGLDKTHYYTLTTNVRAILDTVLTSFLVVLGIGLIGGLIGRVASVAVASLLGSLLLIKYIRSLKESSSHNFADNLQLILRYGFPLYLTILLNFFIGQYRTVVLAFFASDFEIGNFQVTTNFSRILTIMSFPLGILLPAFSKLSTKSTDRKKLFDHSVKYTTLLLVPVTVFITCASEEIVHTLYGPSYALAPVYLSLHILTVLFRDLGTNVFAQILNGLGATKNIFIANLIALGALIPLAPTLIMFIGVPGLIIANIISRFSSIVYMFYTLHTKFDLRVKSQSILKICAVSFFSVIPPLIFFRFSFFPDLINLLLGGVLYLFTLLTLIPLTKTLSTEDIQNLRGMLKNLRSLRFIYVPLFKYVDALLNWRQ